MAVDLGKRLSPAKSPTPSSAKEPYSFLCREYDTPAGVLRHIIRETKENLGAGWVIQPQKVHLFEDFNIPRAVKHIVSGPDDLPKLRYLLQDPTRGQLLNFKERMAQVKRFADDKGILVQGWSAFGIDGIIWLSGVEGAVITALQNPSFFQEFVDIMFNFDRRRTEIMLDVGGVDMIISPFCPTTSKRPCQFNTSSRGSFCLCNDHRNYANAPDA